MEPAHAAGPLPAPPAAGGPAADPAPAPGAAPNPVAPGPTPAPAPAPTSPAPWLSLTANLNGQAHAALAVYEIVPRDGATIISVTASAALDRVVKDPATGRWYVLSLPVYRDGDGDGDVALTVTYDSPPEGSVVLQRRLPSVLGSLLEDLLDLLGL